MSLTRSEFLAVVAGASSASINAYAQPLLDAMEEFGIDTKARQVMFLAQVMTESGHLALVTENLNYSAQGLRKTFPKYYRTDEEALAHARQPSKIGARVYANRMGNGDERSGEGYLYRGRGLIQVTGKNNYEAFGEAAKVDALSNPDYLTTPAGAAQSAAWFWYANNLNRFADKGDIVGCSKAVNGGTNGLDERIAFYKRGMAAIGPEDAAPISPKEIQSNFKALKVGSRGKAVEEVQSLLGIAVDGKYGNGTAAAVKQFQTVNGLDADGVVGAETYAALKK